jgi:hypothetical protein
LNRSTLRKLPSACASNKDFILPHLDNASGDILLWTLFDQIRHGLAHQYQQILVKLNDGKNFYIDLIEGAAFGRVLISSGKSSRQINHLSYRDDVYRDLDLMVYPDTLLLDFEEAIYNLAFSTGVLLFSIWLDQ